MPGARKTALKTVAEAFHVSKETAAKWKQRGCPIPHVGEPDLEAVKRWVAENINTAQSARRTGKLKGVEADKSGPRVSQEDVTHEQWRKTRAEADTKEFELAVKRREYIPRDEIKEKVQRAVTMTRIHLEGIPKSLSVDLCVINDPVEMERTLREHIDNAIEHIHRLAINMESVDINQGSDDTSGETDGISMGDEIRDVQ